MIYTHGISDFKFDDCIWATELSCIHNEITYFKLTAVSLKFVANKVVYYYLFTTNFYEAGITYFNSLFYLSQTFLDFVG